MLEMWGAEIPKNPTIKGKRGKETSSLSYLELHPMTKS